MSKVHYTFSYHFQHASDPSPDAQSQTNACILVVQIYDALYDKLEDLDVQGRRKTRPVSFP